MKMTFLWVPVRITILDVLPWLWPAGVTVLLRLMKRSITVITVWLPVDFAKSR